MQVGLVVSAAELQERLPGVGIAAIRRHLAALHSAGLVDAEQRRPVGLWRRLPASIADLDRLAQELGTAGDTARRRARTEQEREVWSQRTGHDRQRRRRVRALDAGRRSVSPSTAATTARSGDPALDLRLPG